MKKVLFLLLAALPLALAAQDKVVNDPNAEVRNVGAFHAIKVSTGIQLVIKQGNTDAVAVSAQNKDVCARIKTEVVDGVLKIYFDPPGNWWSNWNFRSGPLKAYVSFKNINDFNGSSGSNTTIDGSIAAAGLSIRLSSGAHFKGDIKASNLNVDQGSGSRVELSGEAQTLSVETGSGSHFLGYGVVSTKCNARASSGAKIEITVNEELAASAHSGGGVYYKGGGVITSISTSSGGHIKRDS